MDLLINWVITITVTAAGILIIKKIFRNKMSSRLHLCLWLILIVRILFTFLPYDTLIKYNAFPVVDNIKIQEQTIESIEDDYAAEQIEYITGTIVFNDYSKPFSIHKNIQMKIIIVCLTGMIPLFAYLIVVYIFFSLRLRKVKKYIDEDILSLVDEYKTILNIRKDVSVKLYGSTPMLKGILKSVIILPEDYEIGEIRQMIIHELCHLKNHDILLNAISTILLCLNWYNPVIWMCYSTFKGDLELLCDQNVLRLIKNKKGYATLLMKTSLKSAPSLPMTTCMNNGKNEIKRRINFMANFKKPNILWSMLIIISITILSVGCLSSGVSSNNNDILVPPFEGIQWGMSEVEVMNALKLKEDDVNKDSIGFSSKNELDLFGFRKSKIHIWI